MFSPARVRVLFPFNSLALTTNEPTQNLPHSRGSAVAKDRMGTILLEGARAGTARQHEIFGIIDSSPNALAISLSAIRGYHLQGGIESVGESSWLEHRHLQNFVSCSLEKKALPIRRYFRRQKANTFFPVAWFVHASIVWCDVRELHSGLWVSP